MPIPGNPLYWQVGADCRSGADRSENSYGRIRTNDLSIYGYLSSLRQWFQPTNILNVPSAVRPYVVAAAPFTVDDLGQSFPAGTVWVVCTNTGEGTQPLIMRPPGTSGTISVTIATVSVARPWRGSCPVDVVYYASGMTLASGGSITIEALDSLGGSTLVGSFSVSGNNGPNTCFEGPNLFTSGVMATSLVAGVEAYKITTTWTGPTPRSESINLQESGFNASYIAVPGPTVLPSGYTLNPDPGTLRGGSVQPRYQVDGRRFAANNIHIAMYGFGQGASIDHAIGLPVFASLNAQQSIWINDQCQNYTWLPSAVGSGVFAGGSAAGGVAGIPPHEFFFNSGGPAITSLGARGGVLTITFVQGSIGAGTVGPQPGDAAVITVLCNGSTVYTTTLSGTGIALTSPMVVSISAMMPAGGPGSTCTIQVTMTVSGAVKVDGSGNQQLENWTISAALACSPRCDIPFPFTVASGTDSTLVLPGYYLASALGGTATNHQPLSQAAGTFYSVGTTPAAISFTPGTPGWYQVLSSGTPQHGVGEDEFGFLGAQTLARSHGARPFYCLGAANLGYTLTPFTPSLTGIAGSGTTLDLSGAGQVPYFAFGRFTCPTAGAYRITLQLQDTSQALSGLVIRTSTTDPTLLTYSQTMLWETLDELSGLLVTSVIRTNDPPVNPGPTVACLVDTNPTGAFVGHAGALALWDDIQNQYQFQAPSDAPFASVAGTFWRFGGQWRTATDTAYTFIHTALADGDPVYLGLECFTPGRSTPGRVLVSWAAL